MKAPSILATVFGVVLSVATQAQPTGSFTQAAQSLLPPCMWWGGMVVIIVIGLFTFQSRVRRHQDHRQHLQELQREQRLAATEAVLREDEHERMRLALDIQDGLVGMLSGIKYTLHAIRKDVAITPDNQRAFERSMDMVDSSIQEIRRVAHHLMPEALIRFGLNTALRDFCHDVTQSGTLKINYQGIGMDAVVVDQRKGIVIYRIVQELVYNILKHASATSAIVQVACLEQHISLTVEDNGRGFDTGGLRMTPGRGWTNVGHRVKYLGGRCDITSRLGEGTSVHVELDL